jgi:putative colanic acid biosynthesis glycosyltransferase
VVTPSDWLSNQMRESFFQPFPVYTIHNGIDLTKFKATNIEKRENQKKQVLGVAHKWDNRKGTDFFLKLAKDLENTHHFTMVGVDAGLKDNISKNKLPITMLQKTSSVQELVAFYQEADIFLNPTLQDNFPTVNIEAQACGTPVITFQSGGSGESIQDGTTGLVISQGHYDGLKQALLDWPFKNEQIQRNCIENSKKYDKSVMYHQYKLLYQQLMEKKNGF